MLGTKLDPGAASRCILVLGLLLSASASGSCSSTAQAPQVPGEGLVVTGEVFDRIDGQGVSGVDLYLRTDEAGEQLVATSDENGRYRSKILAVAPGSNLTLRAVGAGSSYYPESVKARMDLAANLWELNFIQAWPVRMWARVAERVYVDGEVGSGIFMIGMELRPDRGGGTQMADVPFYYSVGAGSKILLGVTNLDGELFPPPAWLPIGAEAVFWPEMDGYRFDPADCRWEHGPPLESVGLLFIAEPLDRPSQILDVPCEQVP
jgi:hypothetical protein